LRSGAGANQVQVHAERTGHKPGGPAAAKQMPGSEDGGCCCDERDAGDAERAEEPAGGLPE
jgi:hypothetical protein